MIEITQYKTNDDLIFNNKEDALYHEELCEQVNELARTHLNPRPADMWDECPFPQDKVKIMELETKFIKLVLESKNFKWIIDQGHQIGMNVIGRALCDAKKEYSAPFYPLYYVITCIYDGSEYGQPYFANEMKRLSHK